VNIQKLHPCVEEGIESKFKKTWQIRSIISKI
jgi:hypothetical protein